MLEDLVKGMNDLRFPSVLKTAGYGYDGKGQVKLYDTEQANKFMRHCSAGTCFRRIRGFPKGSFSRRG